MRIRFKSKGYSAVEFTISVCCYAACIVFLYEGIGQRTGGFIVCSVVAFLQFCSFFYDFSVLCSLLSCSGCER